MTLVRLFGLNFDSDQPLPGPVAAGGADVVIRSAPSEETYAEFDTSLDEERRIDIQHDGIRYLVSNGVRIDIDYPATADPARVAGWLSGVGLGAVLVQRGRLPLHANAIALPSGSGVAAFVGESGAGKSTLATQLARAGHDLFCDDLLGVRFDEDCPMVDRGIPRIKLWRDTLAHFGIDEAGLDRVVRDADKFQLPLDDAQRMPESLPLERVYLLEKGDEPAIERVTGAEAGRLVIDNSYRWRVATLWHGGEQWAFDRCLDIARSANVYRFVRPWALDRADESLALLEAHLAQ